MQVPFLKYATYFSWGWKIGRVYFKDDIAYSLNDDDFRTLLELKAVNNNSNHSVDSLIMTEWDVFRGGLIPIESGNMAMMYFLDGSVFNKNILDAAVYHNALPRHLAVMLKGYIPIKDAPYFSFVGYEEAFGVIPAIIVSDVGDFLSINDDDDILVYDEIEDYGSTVAYKLRTGFTDYGEWATKGGYFFNYADIHQF